VKELNEAKVLAVGPGALNKDGQRVAMGVAKGDRVLIPQVGSIPTNYTSGRRGALSKLLPSSFAVSSRYMC
jgi:co-chaperonin GroES (HSP10)